MDAFLFTIFCLVESYLLRITEYNNDEIFQTSSQSTPCVWQAGFFRLVQRCFQQRLGFLSVCQIRVLIEFALLDPRKGIGDAGALRKQRLK